MNAHLKRAAAALAVVGLGASLVATAGPASAEGGTLYVAPWGADYNPDGYTTPPTTAERPWRTITMAIRRAQPGDTVVVRGGTYAESAGWGAVPGRADAPIRLQAAPGERVLIQGTLKLVRADYWTVDGINVTANPSAGRSEYLVNFDGGTGWSFVNSEVYGTRGVSNVMVSGLSGPARGYRIAGNCIHGNRASGDPFMNDHNIYLMPGYASGPGVIERNIIFDARNGANIKAAGPSAATGATRVTIANNTLASAPAGVVVGYGTSRVVMTRNLIGPRVGGNYMYDAAVVGNHIHGAGNVASASGVWSYPTLVRSTKDSANPVRTVAVVRVTPRFDGISSCSAFHPADPTAARYGRFAS